MTFDILKSSGGIGWGFTRLQRLQIAALLSLVSVSVSIICDATGQVASLGLITANAALILGILASFLQNVIDTPLGQYRRADEW